VLKTLKRHSPCSGQVRLGITSFNHNVCTDDVIAVVLIVYQGEHDTSTKLTNEELSKFLDFTRNLFTPTTREQYVSVKERVGDLLDLSGPVMGPEDLEKVLETQDSDAKAVLQRINSLKVLRNDTSPESFTSEAVNGYVLRLERGQLGLVKA
jgi:flavine halogenase